MPSLLPSNTTYTGPHSENCEKAKANLRELNPGFNVFIYYRRIQSPTVHLRDSHYGTFGSRADSGWFTLTYHYDYYVFREGTIVWDGERSNDRICLTQENVDIVGDEYRFQRRDRKKVDWPNWMGQLRNQLGVDRQSQLYLSSLTLPGTHNSHATYENVVDFYYRLPRFAECQKVSIQQQLEMGVRSLDFRLGGSGKLRHGKAELFGELRDVLGTMAAFLDAHPNETIMFQAKWDLWDGTDPPPTDAGTPEFVRSMIQEYPRGLVLTVQPKLSDCVGKMVLFNDDGKGAWSPKNGGDVKWPAGGQGNNDVTKFWDEVGKNLAFVPTNTDIHDGVWYNISLCSQTLDNWANWAPVISGQLEVTRPFKFSEYVNPRALNWLKERPQPGRFGRIVMDFAEHELVHEVVLRNFDFF